MADGVPQTGEARPSITSAVATTSTTPLARTTTLNSMLINRRCLHQIRQRKRQKHWKGLSGRCGSKASRARTIARSGDQLLRCRAAASLSFAGPVQFWFGPAFRGDDPAPTRAARPMREGMFRRRCATTDGAGKPGLGGVLAGGVATATRLPVPRCGRGGNSAAAAIRALVGRVRALAPDRIRLGARGPHRGREPAHARNGSGSSRNRRHFQQISIDIFNRAR